MEESVSGCLEMAELLRVFERRETDLRSYSPLALAYLGDAVYEVVIRAMLLARGSCPVEKLHHLAVRYVKASAQSALITALEGELTTEEAEIYRRGRNAKPHTMPKHAEPADYHRATGCEALFGWLYLKGDTARMVELMRRGIALVWGADAP